MGAFGIFAVVLTAIYVVYYAVMIFLDLHAKPKDESASSAESFDVGDMGFEESKVVEETDGGFRVGRDSEQYGWDTPGADLNPTTEPSEGEPEIKLDASGAPITPAQKKINQAVESMEEIEPLLCGEMANEVMISALLTGKPPLKIKKKIIPPTPKEESEKTMGYDRL